MMHDTVDRAAAFAWQLRHRAWLGARARPELFYAVASRRGFTAQQLVGEETELVIEGFPRSANSFAVVGFKLAQSRPRVLAHHTHAPAQIIRAAQRQLPMLVPIRHPRDAVTSLIIRDPRFSASLALQAYESFYEAVLPLADRMVLATFEEITADLGSVIQSVNRRFGTDFDLPRTSPKQIKKVFRKLERINEEAGGSESTVARPSEWRLDRKRELVADVQTHARYDAALRIYEHATRARPRPEPRSARIIVFSASAG